MTRNVLTGIVFPGIIFVLSSSTSLVAAPVNWNYWTSNATGFMPVGNQNITVFYSSADYHANI